MRISDWSSDVCSSDLCRRRLAGEAGLVGLARLAEAGTQIDDTGQQPLAIRVDGLFEALLRQRGAEAADQTVADADVRGRSEEHTSELQSLMRISYAVFCLKKKRQKTHKKNNT